MGRFGQQEIYTQALGLCLRRKILKSDSPSSKVWHIGGRESNKLLCILYLYIYLLPASPLVIELAPAIMR